MKYIVDLDNFKACLDLIFKPAVMEGYALVRLEDVKSLVDKFPKDEYKAANMTIKPLEEVLDENGMMSVCTNNELMWDKINEIVNYLSQ